MNERKLRVLVVDDHLLNAQIVARLLVRVGMQAALAAAPSAEESEGHAGRLSAARDLDDFRAKQVMDLA